MTSAQRIGLVFFIIIVSLLIINCSLGDLFGPLSRYGGRMQTQESQNATRTAFEVTVSYLESQMDKSTQEPVTNSEIPRPGDTFSEDNADSSSEPLPGMAGIWEYHYISETAKAHMYTMTIRWDGQAYRVSDCSYVKEGGSCLIQNQSWDGKSFSFTLHFPHTITTTVHTVTGVSGNILTGTRYNEQFGAGEIVWSRSQ